MKKFLLIASLILLSQVNRAAAPAETTTRTDTIPSYSGTIPVMFITTVDSVPIVSKEDYVDATYYLETFGLEGYEPYGTKEEQLPLEIRGRGNSSWTNSDKKPYKLKLGSKTPLMGMPKSKHFVLLAEVGTYTQFLSETAGMELGRMIQLQSSNNKSHGV